jgi:DNA-binding Xre family transcriptional regulator
VYNRSDMIVSKFDLLRRQKAFSERRDLSLRKVAEESGLALGTIQRMNNGDISKVHVTTLNALCRYFKLKSVSDLIEYQEESDLS